VYYQKAGVMLMELVPKGGQQIDLFGYAGEGPKSARLMAAVDNINARYSRGTIKFASEGVCNAWVMRRSLKIPNYTGEWKELRVVKSG
jgi:DNA polymerase V